MKKFFKITLTVCALLFAQMAYAALPTVKLLTWWGYFDNKELKQYVEDKCHIDLQIQNYRDDIDFTRLFNQKKFNVVIFESTKLPVIKHRLSMASNNQLSKLTQTYPKFVHEKLPEQTKSKNIAFFVLSDIVFLYNPKNIKINNTDDIPSLIAKLKHNQNKPSFVLLDDPNMISHFIQSDLHKKLNVNSFNSLFNYRNLIVSNDFRDYKNLGIAIIWSGEAFLHQSNAKKKGIDLRIMRLPKYSVITADFIAPVSADKATMCTTRTLASKSFLDKIQSTSWYYSPYLTSNNIKNQDFLSMYKSFYADGKLHKWDWYMPSESDLKNISREWKRITLKYGL